MRRLLVIVGLLALATSPVQAQVEVGAAREDITPDYPVRLHGYLGRDGESRGVAQRIWAKALAIRAKGAEPVVLVSVDNLGVPAALVDEVSGRLKRKAGLDRRSFVVAASHTHSAPCLTNVAPHIFGKRISDREQAAIDRYTRELTDKVEKVSLAALADLRPGTLSWAQGKATFADNRRTKGGPVDHSLPVLRATGPDGKLRAVVVNYACHCTTLDPKDNRISGDWAGYAQEAIEHDHPGAIAMTVIGCGADANPLRRLAPDAAPAHGRAIADEVNRLLAGPWTPLEAPRERRIKEITLAFDTPPTREALRKLVEAGGAPGYNASVHLARLDRGEPLQRELPYAVQAWSFGDALAMVFLPGEVVVDYVLRLKQELDPARLWVTAYANDLPCYIPSERILREGGYEGGGAMVYYARPTRLKPGLEDQIDSAVRDVVPARFAADRRGGDGMPPPLPPAEALGTIRVKPGLRVELVAAEPLVVDPVAIDFGGDGKLWVCEMRDYPAGIDGNWKPGGVIKVLEDRDGDGRYETGTSFLEGLPFPTGVMAWRKGALICAAPEILYAEDTDGDGKADLRKVLYRGFSTENYQARVNGLSYGLDNWVYGANGLIGGSIRGMATGREVNIGGRDFRIRPDTGAMEPASGLTQQGRIRDDWGNQFGNNNSVLLQHYPFPDHYAGRNPRVAAPSPSVYVPRDADSHRIYPASRTLDRFNHPESANRVTSACGPAIYRDSLLGPEYSGNAFTCEPVHNLVHREVLSPDGVTFAGHRAEDEATSEFLASTDNWFRPVQVRTGPDGALWVVDMYRFVIEHPRWISPQQLATLDVRAGSDRGRIYRVLPEGSPPRPVPVLDRLETAALAAQLDSPNGTLRDNAQRLLVHRADPGAAAPLCELAAQGDRPEGRMQALCTLEGLGVLEPGLLVKAAADPHPGVRRHAVRLGEPWLGRDEALTRALLALEGDPEIAVRYQLALSLGEWDDPRAGEVLANLALKDGRDSWVRAAILSSAARQPGRLLTRLIADRADPKVRAAMLGPLIATSGTASGRASILKVVEAMPVRAPDEPASGWQLALVAEWLDAGGAAADAVRRLPFFERALARARVLARDETAELAERRTAIRMLGHGPSGPADDLALLSDLLGPRSDASIQRGALRVLTRGGEPRSVASVIAAWPQMGPGLRAATLDALLARQRTAELLLSALEGRSIHPGEVDASHRQALLNHADAAIRARAVRILSAGPARKRAEVVDAYRAALSSPGDPARGRLVFGKACAACHKLDGQGHEVGPDLAALTDVSPEALVVAILDPNREVDARYASYTAALGDGRVSTGLIAAETGNAITLKRQEGVLETILRVDLDAIRSTGQSLMPEGLENDLKPADMADLVAYLSSRAARPKVLAGNHPETVRQAADGSVRLSAETAEVFGPTLTFETEPGNLGYWHSADDRAAWSFQLERPEVFTVALEWACADESAGNAFEIRVGGRVLPGVVAGTGIGTWSRYRSIFVSEVSLPAGRQRLEIRPSGAVRNALLDLRAITLTPRAR